MIIDDDRLIHERLKNMIEWEANGVHLVCEAQDSDTALELFTLHRPKIVITDIQIPIISGLDLAKEILKISSQVRFIIITGYSDFKYVQASVRLGAVDLISKPILPDEINASIKKATEHFENLKHDHISSQNIELLITQNRPMFQQNFVSYILSSEREYTSNDILNKFKALKIEIEGLNYTVAIVKPQLDGISTSITDEVMVATKNTVTQQLLNIGTKVFSFYDSNYCIVCLISSNFIDSEEKIETAILKAFEQMVFYWNTYIDSGIGTSVSDLTNLFITRNEAFSALNYRLVSDKEPVVSYKNIKRFDTPLIIDKDKLISHALQCLKMDRQQEIKNIIMCEVSNILSANKDNIPLARKFIYEFVFSIISESLSLGLDINSVSKYSDILTELFSANTIESLLPNILSISEKISYELQEKRSDKKNKLIDMATNYIKENLKNSELSLEIVSDAIGLSSIYFCKLFHKEEGITFNTYLNQERTNNAKELLSKTSLKVFEIAYETGYKNHKYFNYVFKRVTGMTPLEYRNSKL